MNKPVMGAGERVQRNVLIGGGVNRQQRFIQSLGQIRVSPWFLGRDPSVFVVGPAGTDTSCLSVVDSRCLFRNGRLWTHSVARSSYVGERQERIRGPLPASPSGLLTIESLSPPLH